MSAETIRLSPTGQAVQGGIASVLINAIIHPIGTIKNRLMVGQEVSLPSLP